jgi:hypothetical protein
MKDKSFVKNKDSTPAQRPSKEKSLANLQKGKPKWPNQKV